MEEEKYVCVAVTYKKYMQLLDEVNGWNCVHAPGIKTLEKKEPMTRIEEINSLPLIITEDIDEDIKFLTEEEAKKISRREEEKIFKNIVEIKTKEIIDILKKKEANNEW